MRCREKEIQREQQRKRAQEGPCAFLQTNAKVEKKNHSKCMIVTNAKQKIRSNRTIICGNKCRRKQEIKATTEHCVCVCVCESKSERATEQDEIKNTGPCCLNCSIVLNLLHNVQFDRTEIVMELTKKTSLATAASSISSNRNNNSSSTTKHKKTLLLAQRM